MAEFNLEEMLSKIMQSPDIMEKVSNLAKSSGGGNPIDALPQVMEAIMPAIENGSSHNEDKNTDTGIDKTDATTANTLQLPIEGICKKIQKNSQLLVALKPYLSKERCDVVDSLVKMAQVANLLTLTK